MIRPKRYLMKVRGFELQFGDRTLLMGVLNVTPDSFSDGGKYEDPDRAVARALELEAQGADIIDIGAESTKPGAKPVSEGEELRRLIPLLKKLEGKLSIPISVDTYKSAVAERALEYGVAFINDPSNGTIDSQLASVVAQHDAGLILNHMRGTPETWAKPGNVSHPAELVLTELETSINRAQKARVDRGRLIIDPGLGFGKRGDQNYEILTRLDKLRALDLPIMVGPSRKSFLGQKNNDNLQQDFATAAAVTGAILCGAHMVRVHNLEAMACVVHAADALLRNSPEEVRDFRDKKRGARDERPFGDRGGREQTDAPPPSYTDRFRPERPMGGAPRQDRPREDRFAGNPREDRPKYERDRPIFDKSKFDRPSFDRPRGDRPSYDKPRGDRPPFDKPRGNRPPFERTWGDRPSFERPRGDRPSYDKPRGDRPPFDKPRGDRPPFDRSRGDRPSFDKPRFDKPRGDRPPFDKPRGDRPPFDRSRGGDRPPFDKPRGDRPPFDRPRGDRPGGGRPPREGGPPRGPRPVRPRFPR